MNLKNMKLVIEKIESDPASWDQTKWHCGATHCFFGWAQILSGSGPYVSSVIKDGKAFLDLSTSEASYFSHPTRTLKDFKDAVSGEDGFNQQEFNEEGFDRLGSNRNWYNQEGFNQMGFDKEGYNKEGYDKEGYNRNQQFN